MVRASFLTRKKSPACWLDFFMERVTSLRRLVPLALLWLHCRPAGNARQSTGLSDSIVRASSPAKKPSRLAGLFSGAGDEASPPRAAGTPMVALPSSRQCPTVHRTVGFNCSSLVTRKKAQPFGWTFYGAGDEARTRYLHLGKVALYRMSYTRIKWCLRSESNQRHADFQSAALPTELQRHLAPCALPVNPWQLVYYTVGLSVCQQFFTEKQGLCRSTAKLRERRAESFALRP